MFRKHLEKQQLRSRECGCALAGNEDKEKYENRCFLRNPKAIVHEMAPQSNYSLERFKTAFKNDRKYSLKPGVNQNSNQFDYSRSNTKNNVESMRQRMAEIENKYKKGLNFNYEEQPQAFTKRNNGPVGIQNNGFNSSKLTANWQKSQKCQTQTSTIASIVLPQNQLQNHLKNGQKVSIFSLKKRLITQTSANTQMEAKDLQQKMLKGRALSTLCLNRPHNLYNNSQIPSSQAATFKEILTKKSPLNFAANREGHKLEELCFKKAQSVTESQSDQLSQIQSNSSVIMNEGSDIESTWNLSLNDMFQKRQQRLQNQL